MKTTKKIHKLIGLIVVLAASTAPVCYNDHIFKKEKSIKDLKAELTTTRPADERKIAKNIAIKNDGINYNETFIPKTNNGGFRVLTVRLTVYWAKGGDTDADSRRLRSSTGYTLKQGDSIAVDPRIIPYQKEVIIPNIGLVKAVDTGTAVREKKASNGKLPVIDVFFTHKKDAIAFANAYPKIVKVAVLN